jgi:virginiamycin B lyase
MSSIRTSTVRAALNAGMMACWLIASPPAPAAPTIVEYPVPPAFANPAGAGPLSLANGPDGNLWFTEITGGGIGRIDMHGNVAVFALPGPYTGPFGATTITNGTDGNLWFTDASSNQIGRITPDGAITEFPIPTANAEPFGITAGPDGNLWFTEKTGNKIGTITPSGAITEYSVPTPFAGPAGITLDPDGNILFAEIYGQLGTITVLGAVTESVVDGGLEGSIAAASDGTIWFTTPGVGCGDCSPRAPGRIDVLTTAGSELTFGIYNRANYSNPRGIAFGADGNMWFVEQSANYVASISITGRITTFGIPTDNSGANEIVSGPDGNIWFAETTAC